MNRETKKITTPSGEEVEFYTYITGKEARQLQSIFLKHSKFEEGDEKKSKLVDFDAVAVTEAEELAIKLMIVSVSGVIENAAARVENMRQPDYRAVVKAINDVTKSALDPSDFLTQ